MATWTVGESEIEYRFLAPEAFIAGSIYPKKDKDILQLIGTIKGSTDSTLIFLSQEGLILKTK